MLEFIKANWKVATLSAVIGVLLADVWASLRQVIGVVDWTKTTTTLLNESTAQFAFAGVWIPAILIFFLFWRFKFDKSKPEPLTKLMFVGIAFGNLSIFALHVFIGDAGQILIKMQQDKLSAVMTLAIPLFLLARWALLAIKDGQGLERRQGS